MTSTNPLVTISPLDYDAFLFDLDGVLTRTASIHAAAWKRMFDDFLEERSGATGEPFVPFDIESDYRRYVDGKPRHDGVASFLASRGIELPWGSHDDGPGAGTVHGLGGRKDGYFLEHMKTHGVERFEESVDLVRKLRELDIRLGVVSSSKNAAEVLEAAGIADLFETRVDGKDILRFGFSGKPAPDAFLEGARRLKVDPSRTVVVEDAIAGVQAGRAGMFGLVIGIDHYQRSKEMREAGADVVVTGLAQVRVSAEPPSSWVLAYEDFDPAQEGTREALCALGNGYFATRGAAPGAVADDVHYPGTYLAGGYNRRITEIAGRIVENEVLVNLPNWLFLRFRIADGEWFDARMARILSYRQELDLARGMLTRDVRFEDGAGRRTRLREERLVSMNDKHLAALEVSLTAENWTDTVTVRSAIDGRVVNSGARLYREFNNRHLVPVGSETVGGDGVFLEVRTRQSNLHVGQAARTRAYLDGRLVSSRRRLIESPGFIGQELKAEVREGQTLVLEKVASLYTSRDHAISEAGLAARKAVVRAPGIRQLKAEHVLAWKHLWRRFDVHLRPTGSWFRLNVQMLLRLNMLHLLQAVSPNSIDLDIGVPPRGWTGEAYEGHIFWDELFIFPFFTHRVPEITRTLLMYRHRRLPEARAAARYAGYAGAMFPWQSGSDGQEETQEYNLNPRSRRWVRDDSFLQRHVGSAIAYNVWEYYQATHDLQFLQYYGAELILDIARFWSSLAYFDEGRQRYVIRGVMGPDEFHTGYPDAPSPGLDNNAYTNVLAVWVFCRALEVLDLLPDMNRAELSRRLGLSQEEIARWEDISRKMYVPIGNDGIIWQFEGYERLAELDWEKYRARYDNIQRMELILEAENDSANRYKVSKQPDVLMLFYLFSSEELAELFGRLGYGFRGEMIPKNVAYYAARSTQGSTLARVVDSWVMARSDRARSMRYFAEALQSDVGDIQQGTAAEGIHLGAMAGTVNLVERVSTGIETRADYLRLNPQLPEELERLDMRIRYRGLSIDLRVTRDTLTVRGRDPGAGPIRLRVYDEEIAFQGGDVRTFPVKKG